MKNLMKMLINYQTILINPSARLTTGGAGDGFTQQQRDIQGNHFGVYLRQLLG